MSSILNGLASLGKQAKTLSAGPGDADQGIAAKSKMIDEYNKATKASPAAPAAKAPAGKPSPKDKINPKAKYGDKPGEQRLDVSEMVKPLGKGKAKGGLGALSGSDQ